MLLGVEALTQAGTPTLMHINTSVVWERAPRWARFRVMLASAPSQVQGCAWEPYPSLQSPHAHFWVLCGSLISYALPPATTSYFLLNLLTCVDSEHCGSRCYLLEKKTENKRSTGARKSRNEPATAMYFSRPSIGDSEWAVQPLLPVFPFLAVPAHGLPRPLSQALSRAESSLSALPGTSHPRVLTCQFTCPL